MPLTEFIMTGIGWNKPSYNSQISYRKHISQFEIFLESRNKAIHEGTVTDQDVSDYVELLRPKYKQNTVYAKITTVRAYFRWLQKEGMLTHIPNIQAQKRGFSEHQKLSDSDVNTIIQNMRGDTLNSKRDLTAFLLIIRCGFKVQEIVAMNTEDIDLDNAEVTVENKKRSFRTVSTEMQDYVNLRNKLEEGRKSLFFNRNGHRLSDRGLRREIMRYTTKIGPYNLRDLRHTYFQNISNAKQEVLAQ